MPNNEDRFKIDRDGVSTRKMDLSPTRLAKELCNEDVKMAYNTLRNRIAATNLDFSVTEGMPGSYILYDFECLPILRAYLKTYTRGKRETPLEEFLEQLQKELAKAPTFTQDFLYSQDIFQSYVLNAAYQDPVQQRLDCISKLSKQLCTSSAESEEEAFDGERLKSVLEILNQTILQLSRAVNETNKETSPEASSGKDELLPKNLIEIWCSTLKERRASCYDKEKRVIELSCPSTASLPVIEASLDAILQETLTRAEHKRALQVRDILDSIDSNSKSAQPLTPEEQDICEKHLTDCLVCNLEAYLFAVMKYQVTPDFSVPKGCDLRKMFIDFSEAWMEQTKSITAALERFFHGLLLLFKATLPPIGTEIPAYFSDNPDISQFLLSAEDKIRIFWTVMRKADYTPQELDPGFFYRVRLDLKVTDECLTFKNLGAPIEIFLENVLLEKKPPVGLYNRIRQDLYATAITLEYFWRTHAQKSVPQIMEDHAQFAKALQGR